MPTLEECVDAFRAGQAAFRRGFALSVFIAPGDDDFTASPDDFYNGFMSAKREAEVERRIDEGKL